MRAHKSISSLLALLLAISLMCSLTACSKMEDVQATPGSANTGAQEVTSETEAGEATTDASPTPEDDDDEANFDIGTEDADQGVLSSGETIEYYTPPAVKNPGNRTVTLFIWNVDTYKTVQWHYRDNLTVQKLLEGLAHETNWELSTAAIKLRDQSCTLWWANSSSLFTGLPKRQNKEYIVFNQKDLDAAILDSVRTTIIENLGYSYSVYYAGPNGGDLVLPEVNVTIPVDEAFSSFWDY